MAMTWEEYGQNFAKPYDISDPWAWRDDPEYDMKRKANLQWEADYYNNGYSAQGPSNYNLNPYIGGGGGWYYGAPTTTEGGMIDLNVSTPGEWVGQTRPTQNTNWDEEAAAGRPVIGGYMPKTPTRATQPWEQPTQQPAALTATQPGFNLGQLIPPAAPQAPAAVTPTKQASPFTGTQTGAMGGTIGDFWNQGQNNNQTSMVGGVGNDWQSMFDEWKKNQYGGA